MKKTKIFIAACCLIVAGVGVAATKAHTKASFNYYYEVTVGNPATCEPIVVQDDPGCQTAVTTPCTITIGAPISAPRQLFLTETGVDCTNALSLKP